LRRDRSGLIEDVADRLGVPPATSGRRDTSGIQGVSNLPQRARTGAKTSMLCRCFSLPRWVGGNVPYGGVTYRPMLSLRRGWWKSFHLILDPAARRDHKKLGHPCATMIDRPSSVRRASSAASAHNNQVAVGIKADVKWQA
jgi:hypothetical protein